MKKHIRWKAGLLAMFLAITTLGAPLYTEASGISNKKKKAKQEEKIERTYLTMTDIAAMNEVEEADLDASYENGRLTYLGHSFYTGSIENSDDARYSLEGMAELLGIKGMTLVFDRSYTESQGAYTVYQFRQAALQESGSIAVIYKNMVKVIVDTEGKTIALSSNLDPSLVSVYGAEEFFTKGEAERIITNETGSADRIHSEATVMVYWTDDEFFGLETNFYAVPAWVVFSNTNTTNSTLQYRVDIMSALRLPESMVQTYGESIYRLAAATSYTLDAASLTTRYNSEFDFRRMENAGQYTYNVDLTFVKDTKEDFKVKNNKTVTVPVMRDTLTGLYTLGSLDQMIMVTNESDYRLTGTLNPIVSENPEDPAAWHYLYGADSRGVPYVLNISYVLAAYNCLTEADEASASLQPQEDDRMPKLLTVYSCDGQYPQDGLSFSKNMGYAGRQNDWAVFNTSPADASCLSNTSMIREIIESVSSDYGMTAASGEGGAMTTAEGEILAILASSLYEADLPQDKAFQIGGRYSSVTCDLSDLISTNRARAYNDVLYCDASSETLGDVLDVTASYVNSGLPEYLVYRLLNAGEEELKADEEAFTTEALLRLFAGIRDLFTGNDSFSMVGRYLNFLAPLCELTEGQINYLERLLTEHGFANSEASVELTEAYLDASTFGFDFSDRSFSRNHSLAVTLISYGRPIASSVVVKSRLKLQMNYYAHFIPRLAILDKETGDVKELDLMGAAQTGFSSKYTIHMIEKPLSEGQQFFCDPGYSILGVSDPDSALGQELLTNQYAAMPAGSEYYVSVMENDGTYGEIFVYHVYVPSAE